MKIRKWVNWFIYQFSTSKRQLDQYTKMFRRGHKFSDSEIVKLKELIEYENLVYGRQ